jgi:predicted enzyme related to lactoylglutathione lyase
MPQYSPGPTRTPRLRRGYAVAEFRGAADADETAAAVAEHGGAILLTPGDVGPLGRMAIATDPTGAVFGVWQAGMHIAGLVNEPCGLTWED